MVQLPVLSAEECEHYFRILEITRQCKALERRLVMQKHMAFVVHVQLCRQQLTDRKCQVKNCERAKTLLNHALNCLELKCRVKQCNHVRELMFHYDSCPNQLKCPVCTYAREMNGDRYFLLKTHRLFSPTLESAGDFQTTTPVQPNRLSEPAVEQTS